MRTIGNQCVGVRADEYRCRSTGVYWVNGIPFCEPHYEQVALHFGADPSSYGPGDIPAVVYYIGDPDTQLVKIGATTRLHQRFGQLALTRPKLKLLAVEPGYVDMERQRHREFQKWRVKGRSGREWFHRNDVLMEHVRKLRQQYGDPWEFDPHTHRPGDMRLACNHKPDGV